jgi:glycosyltransferase involved in cell wall biosynthesis
MLLQYQLDKHSHGVVHAADSSLATADRALRILLIVESSGAGTGRHVLDLASGLIARGCDVHLIYSTNRMDRAFSRRLADMRFLCKAVVPMRTSIHPQDILAVRSVFQYVRAAGPFDVIHGHSSKGGAIARLAAIIARVPAFYTLHGLIMMDPMLAGWKRFMYLSIERALALATSRIIAVSPEEARAAVALKLGRSRVVIVPNGVDKPELAPRSEARRAMEIPDDAVVAGFVGRLVVQKAPDVLLHAFARASASVPTACLAMIGSGPMDKRLRNLARVLGIADRVRWLGECDAREFLAGFDVFALASRKEGLPYVVLEAMAAGLPVVAASSAGVESLLTNDENGYIVRPDDPDAFAEGLVSLLRDPVRRAAFGQASLDRVAHFSIDAMVDRTLDLYCQAVYAEEDVVGGDRGNRPGESR